MRVYLRSGKTDATGTVLGSQGSHLLQEGLRDARLSLTPIFAFKVKASGLLLNNLNIIKFTDDLHPPVSLIQN